MLLWRPGRKSSKGERAPCQSAYTRACEFVGSEKELISPLATLGPSRSLRIRFSWDFSEDLIEDDPVVVEL